MQCIRFTSDACSGSHREAGLLLEYPQMAKYYESIFDSDWETGVKTLPKKKGALEFFGPEALASSKVVPLNWGDYAEV